jgi:hypothetical protein
LKVQLELGLAAAIFLAVPSLAPAQRGPMAIAPRASVHLRTATPSSTVSRAGSRSISSRTTKASNTSNANDVLGLNGGTPLSIQELLNPLPGSGFNFGSLSIINEDLGIKALIDPATQARLALAERFLRESQFAPGYFLLDGGGYYAVPVDSDQQPQAQQPVVIVQQAPQPEATAQEAEEPPPTEAAAPLPDEGEFTLVLRDGKQFQAAAFTRINDKIVYITPEGGRRTVAVADLDTDATLRINQERGTPLQLPL